MRGCQSNFLLRGIQKALECSSLISPTLLQLGFLTTIRLCRYGHYFERLTKKFFSFSISSVEILTNLTPVTIIIPILSQVDICPNDLDQGFNGIQAGLPSPRRNEKDHGKPFESVFIFSLNSLTVRTHPRQRPMFSRPSK